MIELRSEKLVSELSEEVDITTGHETMLADDVLTTKKAKLTETVSDSEGGFVGRTDQGDIRPHHVSDRAREEWVMGAAQEQRVNFGGTNWCKQPLGQHHHFVTCRLPTFDELHEARARSTGQLHRSTCVDNRSDIRP